MPNTVFSLGFLLRGCFSYSILLLDIRIYQALPLRTFYSQLYLPAELITSSEYKCPLYLMVRNLIILAQTWLVFLTCTPKCLLDLFTWMLFQDNLDATCLEQDLKKRFSSLVSVYPFTHARKLGIILILVCLAPMYSLILYVANSADSALKVSLESTVFFP